jgi:ketosteroid isomerase-like protein
VSDNVHRVQSGYDAFSRGDLDRAVQHMHPEVQLSPAIQPLESGSLIQGRDGVREFWQSLRVWESLWVEILDIIEAGGPWLSASNGRTTPAAASPPSPARAGR